MAVSKSAMDLNMPRLRRLRVRMKKKPSTAFSQDAEVGVKWNTRRGMVGEPTLDLRVLVRGVVVEDRVDHLAGRHRALDGVEELDEILMPVRHAAADDLSRLKSLRLFATRFLRASPR
jgi:hypothetical protein